MLDSAGVHVSALIICGLPALDRLQTQYYLPLCLYRPFLTSFFSLSLSSLPSLFLLGSGHDRGERAGPPGDRATDCHVLWPPAPAHEPTEWPVGAGSSGPQGLLQRAQRNPVLLSGGRVLTLVREIT